MKRFRVFRLTTTLTARGIVTITPFLWSCGGAVESDEALDRRSDEIFRGHPLVAPTHTGIVRITSGSGKSCTGTLLTSRWVLTAAHCFCTSDLNNPQATQVTPYGTMDVSENPGTASLYASQASQIIEHEDGMDVALVKLSRALPLAAPANIYTGSGTGLSGQLQCWGFGNTGYVNGDPTQDESGAGQRLMMGELQFDRIDSGTSTGGPVCGRFAWYANPGFWTKPTTTNTSSSEYHYVMKGDSGGPCFTGSGASRVLVGVNSAGSGASNKHLGIWHVRDWIRQNTDIWSRAQCEQVVPSSSQATDPALAYVPESTATIHLVARVSNQIRHWKSLNASTWTTALVPNAATDRTPAIAQHLATGPVRLGLAYRDSATGSIKYGLWTASGGWNVPATTIPNLTTNTGPALAPGILAYVRSNGKVGGAGWDMASNQWFTMDLGSASPLANASKHPSVVSDQTLQASMVGYWSSSSQFMRALGSWSWCSPTAYWCDAGAATPTGYAHRVLGYTPLEGVYTVSRLSGGDLVFEYDWNGTSWFWGNAGDSSTVEPAIADLNGRLYLAYTVSTGIRVRPLDNCLGNTPPGW